MCVNLIRAPPHFARLCGWSRRVALRVFIARPAKPRVSSQGRPGRHSRQERRSEHEKHLTASVTVTRLGRPVGSGLRVSLTFQRGLLGQIQLPRGIRVVVTLVDRVSRR